jgi:hypothetical protein
MTARLLATGSVGIVVTPLEDAPVANSLTVTMPEDTSTNLVLTGSDVDGNALTFIIVTAPTNGVLSLIDTNAGTLTYTPNVNYNGGDSFTFRVNDGTLNSSIATVFITVTPSDDGPIANNQNVTIPEDTSTNLVLVGSDIDSTVTYAHPERSNAWRVGDVDTNTGAVTYTPTTNYNGADSFTFTVSDGSLLATGTVFITVTPVNDTPFVADDSYSMFKNAILTVPVSGVLTNDSDVDGNPLTAPSGTGPLTRRASRSMRMAASLTRRQQLCGPGQLHLSRDRRFRRHHS